MSAHTSTLRSSLDALHILSLSVWLGALLGAGLSAAILFPTMKSLDPRLPGFHADVPDHWMIAAGQVANRVFLIADGVQLACAIASVLTIGLAMRLMSPGGPAGRPPLLGWRILLISAAAGLVCYELFILSPRMAVSIRQFWDAAQAGDLAKASSARAAFNDDHPIASTVLTTTAGAVLVSLVAAALSKAWAPKEPKA